MNPYDVLGLPRDASEEDAKLAFRKLAKTCHPDLHPNDATAERKFKEINAAYDAIRNPQPEPQFREFRFDEFSFGGGGGAGPFPFEDIFANLRGFTRQNRNNDIRMECRLTLEVVFKGTELDIAVPSQSNPRTVKIRVPPGVEDGTNMRIVQAGDHSNKTLRPGDLYVTIRTMPHASLTRLGRNLMTTVPVSAFDVLLGREIEVTGIDGKVLRVPIPSGFDTQRKLRLSGQGMQDANGRGDLLIELFILFEGLTDEQRVLIQQAAEKASRDHRQHA